MMQQLNKTNVTNPNATGDDTMHDDQSFEKFRHENNMLGVPEEGKDFQEEISQ
jgi:hypothetical protein